MVEHRVLDDDELEELDREGMIELDGKWYDQSDPQALIVAQRLLNRLTARMLDNLAYTAPPR